MIHCANVWIRGCNHNLKNCFKNLDADCFEGDQRLADYLSRPPAALLRAGPGAARAAMKEGIKLRPLFSGLLTPAELASVVTPADVEAEREFQRSDSSGAFTAFLEGYGAFSPTEDGDNCSWVVWALDQVEVALWQVAWKGVPLSSPVPANLSMYIDGDWSKAREHLTYIPLSRWLVKHRAWLGPLVEVFHRARGQLVTATLTSGLSDPTTSMADTYLNVRDRVFGDQHLVGLIAGFEEVEVPAEGEGEDDGEEEEEELDDWGDEEDEDLFVDGGDEYEGDY